MITYTQRIFRSAARVGEALKLEPGVRPDFARADLTMITVVMYCLLGQGNRSPAGVYRYLSNRGCQFDRRTIDTVFDLFDGDDPKHHLWRQDMMGDYVPSFAEADDLDPID